VPDRWLTKCVVCSHRAMVAFLVHLRGAFEGVWLGVLRDHHLAAVGQAHYDSERFYSQPSYNEQGLWDLEARAVEAHFPADARVVVNAAGGGREVLALLRAGYDVDGFECHRGLADAGAQLLARAGYPHRLHRIAPSSWPSTCHRYDAAVVGWGAYMLIPTRAQRIRFLRDSHDVLHPGSPLLLSFFTMTTNVERRLRTTARVGSIVGRVVRGRHVEFGDSVQPNYVHYFRRDDIESELNEGGFELLEYWVSGYGWVVGRRL
jgi:hypothetical protein